jgi:microcystin-dependent protein
MSAVNPSLFNSIFSATYAYAPDVSGGLSYFQPQINIRNVHSLEVDTLTSSHITQGDVSGNLFFGNDAGQGASNTCNCTSLGVNTLYDLQNSRNVTALGFESLFSATALSNVVAIGVNVGFDGNNGMQSVSNSVFVGDGIGLNLCNGSNEIVIGTNTISQAIGSSGGNILLGVGAFGSNTNLGSSNVIIGTNAGTGTVNAPSNCIFIGAGTVATGNNVTGNYINIGNTIYGNTSNKYIGIGKVPTIELDVSGTIRSAIGDIVTVSATTVSAATMSAATLIGNTGNITTVSATTVNATTGNITTVNATTVNGNGTIPIGGIILWSGATTSIPTGWALCDGTSSTPNLTGRFILGYLSGTYSVNASGGNTTALLTASNIPPHEHTYSSNSASAVPNGCNVGIDGGGIGTTAGVNNNSATLSTGSVILDASGAPVGGPTAFSIMPPYYVLAYIMRTT